MGKVNSQNFMILVELCILLCKDQGMRFMWLDSVTVVGGDKEVDLVTPLHYPLVGDPDLG